MCYIYIYIYKAKTKTKTKTKSPKQCIYVIKNNIIQSVHGWFIKNIKIKKTQYMGTNSEQSDTLARMSYSQEANCIAFASPPVDVLNIFEKRDITSTTILQQIIGDSLLLVQI